LRSGPAPPHTDARAWGAGCFQEQALNFVGTPVCVRCFRDAGLLKEVHVAPPYR
jgi:hypothetical protein